jgi:protein arginine kinase activator
MKCSRCEKPATFHITERVGDREQWDEVHLCEDCAREYLSKPSSQEADESLAGALAQHLKIGQTAEELARLDQRTCPVCGITFYEFRQHGRLGCPHDYVCFEQEMEPLLVNIHGEAMHAGKRPKRSARNVDEQTQLIRLRREMREAVQSEDYERASRLRDEIRKIEGLTS